MLYAPLLPHHAALRGHNPGFRQILPVHRWLELIRASAHVRPMQDPGDCARYVTDLCQFLNWVHPMQIMKVAMDGPETVSNPLAMIYLWAQHSRARSLSAFLGVQDYLFSPSPVADAWRERFNFVILDYSDCTNYHTNKDFLQSMTTRCLNQLGMRCIMMGHNLKIRAPYRGNAGEHEWMTDWLRTRFKTLFGRDFPSLQFV